MWCYALSFGAVLHHSPIPICHAVPASPAAIVIAMEHQPEPTTESRARRSRLLLFQKRRSAMAKYVQGQLEPQLSAFMMRTPSSSTIGAPVEPEPAPPAPSAPSAPSAPRLSLFGRLAQVTARLALPFRRSTSGSTPAPSPQVSLRSEGEFSKGLAGSAGQGQCSGEGQRCSELCELCAVHLCNLACLLCCMNARPPLLPPCSDAARRKLLQFPHFWKPGRVVRSSQAEPARQTTAYQLPAQGRPTLLALSNGFLLVQFCFVFSHHSRQSVQPLPCT